MVVRRSWMVSAAAVMLGAAACGDNKVPIDEPYFEFDGQHAIGAMSFDQLDASNDAPLLSKLKRAKDENWVVMVYGHRPGVMVSLDTVEAFLQQAQELELPFYTFADLAANPEVAHPGINLSFDDTEIDEWWSLRPLLAKYHAHASFFVTRYYSFTDEERTELHMLYAEGNSIEAHGVNHVNGTEYVAQHGLDAYMTNEVQPSIDILIADGFTPMAFAHPYGAHTQEINEAIEDRIPLVRSISQTPLPGRDVH